MALQRPGRSPFPGSRCEWFLPRPLSLCSSAVETEARLSCLFVTARGTKAVCCEMEADRQFGSRRLAGSARHLPRIRRPPLRALPRLCRARSGSAATCMRRSLLSGTAIGFSALVKSSRPEIGFRPDSRLSERLPALPGSAKVAPAESRRL